MNSRKAFFVTVYSIVLALALAGSVVFADEFDQAMRLTLDQPVAVPGQVLQPGSYWFILIDHGATPNVIQVFDGDRKHLLATIQTGNEEIVKPSGRITLSFADRSPRPFALLSLVYPGRTDGHQFGLVYKEQERRQFSEFPKITMKVGDKGELEKIENEH